MNDFAESSELHNDVREAAKLAFRLWGGGQTEYKTWQELETDVWIRVLKQDKRYPRRAKWKTILTTFARNLLIDARRQDRTAKRRRDLEVGFTDQEWDSLLGRSGEEIFYRVLVNECIEKLSPEDRRLYARRNRKMEVLGKEFGATAAKISRRLKRIVKQIEECCTGRRNRD